MLGDEHFILFFRNCKVAHKCVCHLYFVLRTVIWFSKMMACLLT